MTVTSPERIVPPEMTPEQLTMLGSASRMLMAALDCSRAATITVESDDGASPAITVPPQVLRVLARVIGLMAEGQPVTLVPERQEMTTVEAANFLNVSRPFLVKEIEAGRLKHRKVGTHRRVLFTDLVAYANAMQVDRQRALENMAADARELGLYDDE